MQACVELTTLSTVSLLVYEELWVVISPTQAARAAQSHRMEGLRGLYKGVGASAAGMGVYLGVSFAVYEELTGASVPTEERALRGTTAYAIAKMGAGAAAGMLGQVQTTGVPCVQGGVWESARE